MKKGEISKEGMIFAALLALVGTIGHFVTKHSFDRLDDEWLLVFAVSVLTLCVSAVNFERKRRVP